MANRRSLPELHSRVTANASQFVSEFQRADNVSRRSVANIDREMSKLEKSVTKKFSVSDISKSFLGGLGFGSGFAAASTAASLIVGHWERAAEEAKSVEAATAAQLRLVQQIISARQNDDQRRATAWKDERAAMRAFFDAQVSAATNFQTRLGATGVMGAGALGSLLDVFLGSTTAADVAEKRTAWQEAFKLWDEIDQKIKAKGTTEKKKADEKAAEEMAQRIAAANEWRTRTQLEYNSALEKEAEALMRSIATPQEEHAARLKRIETLYQAGKLSVEEYTRAMTESFKKLDAEEAKAVEDKLNDFFGDLDKQSTTMIGGVKKEMDAFDREMSSMWNNVSDRAGQAFADMVLTGEARFSDLADIVARSIIEIITRMAIINPILNALFGGFGVALPTFFGGGGKARGGAVEAGYTYRVNEDGQEFFKPDVGGTIIPVGASKGLHGQGGGVTYAPVYNIAAGVTRQEILPILKAHGRAIVAAIADTQRRGAPITAAFA
jgi:hypothetical protein